MSLSAQQRQSVSPFREANGNGMGTTYASNGHSRPHSPQGFVAVNSSSRREPPADDTSILSAAQFMFPHSSTDNVTIINGTSIKGASPATRAELMKKFFTTADRHTRGYQNEEDVERPAPPARQTSRSRPRASDPGEYGGAYTGSGPVPIPNTPTSLLPQLKSSNHYERDDGGPYKVEMVSRMEGLQRGERILPPCDRCRRLQMDCHKNLTACMGCTKKHAKCSWKEVKVEELRETYPVHPRSNKSGSKGEAHDTTMTVETDAEAGSGGHQHLYHRQKPLRPRDQLSGTETDPHHRVTPTWNNYTNSPPRIPTPQTQPPQLLQTPFAGAADMYRSHSNSHGHIHSPHHTHLQSHQHQRTQVQTQTPLDTEMDDGDSTDPLTQAIRDTMGKHNLAAAVAATAQSSRDREGERERDRLR
ncbi:C6 finger domain-containing protein [Histoplasma capsulatum H143]|uniref:C6 finger domain-containing protein n=1 Tax=Ajellomyces capsulatus (strain H143) TaxID=544712 RepID=C6HNR6_AJECH|nr:C6 finger domain-containing protein [Histoplasma capsulatum H143]